jgi:hypothetical protein
MVVLIGPVAGAVPIFVTVTGTILGEPATNGVKGCPIVVTKSGAAAAAIGVIGCIGVAGLLPVLVAGSFGAEDVAVVGGVVPTVLAAGVTGTNIVEEFPGAILLKGFGLEQETICPVVVHVLPFEVNDGGALNPTGNVIVAVTGPVAGAVP